MLFIFHNERHLNLLGMYIKLILHFRFNWHLNLLGMFIKLILHFRFNWHLNLLGMYIKLILHFRFNWDLKLIEGCATQCAGGRIGFQKKYEVKILNDLFSHIIFRIVQYPFFKS
jgi:hypothetical protein